MSAPRDDNFIPALLAEDDTVGGDINVKAKTGTGALYVHIDSNDVTIPISNDALDDLAGGNVELTAYQGGSWNIGNVSTVGTITPGTSVSSLGKAEDDAHFSGSVG